ncbi:hypothetical protein LSTR_LSTR009662 [Laodelphax striatellus]|uniref:Uncharacterized protein n=1 Tax=Laodelphax striatellus TaxID=195883 RepID=A0A482WPX4_LAOST|nr:hypothetical protein LSTR_LSTR009662 [Laodelphax striatellus]
MNIYALHLTTALVVMSLVGVEARPAGPVLSLVGLLKGSVAGTPQFFKQQKWDFDPEVSSRRQVEFQKVHGYRSLKLIEELGLGEDGRKLERLQQQRLRDQYVPVSGPIYEHK